METDDMVTKGESADSLTAEFSKEKVSNPNISELGEFLKGPRAIPSLAMVGIFLLLCVAFLYFSRVFFLPVVLALMVSFLLKPVVRWLERIRIPPPLGAAIVVLLALLAIGNGFSHIVKPATELVAQAPENIRKVERKIREWMPSAARFRSAASEADGLAKTSAAEQATKVEIKRSSMSDLLLSYTTSFLGGTIETIVLLYFFLASGDLFLQKLVKVLPTLHDKKQAVEIAHEVQESISTFMLTVTVINAGLGICVALGLYFLGMPNPALWGVVAGLMNFVPYFGPIAGVGLLGLAGLINYPSVAEGLVPPAIYLGLHAVEANFITPMILGRRLTLNPVVIFVSLMFWMWLWGIPGAVLAVPLLMMMKIFCDHFKPLASIGEFLSG